MRLLNQKPLAEREAAWNLSHDSNTHFSAQQYVGRLGSSGRHTKLQSYGADCVSMVCLDHVYVILQSLDMEAAHAY